MVLGLWLEGQASDCQQSGPASGKQKSGWAAKACSKAAFNRAAKKIVNFYRSYLEVHGYL